MADLRTSELRTFVEVARRRSFRDAADVLGVSRSALSHAISTLESRLGVRLLNRTTRSVSLTPAGEALLLRAPSVIRDLDDLLNAVGHGQDEVVGVLRINAEPLAGRWLVQNALPSFTARHPGVSLDLVTDGRFIDIVAEGFDAGVRLGSAVQQDMVAVPFGGEIRFLAVASPDYLAAHGRPTMPQDLLRHQCVRQRLPSGKRYRWEFARGAEEIVIDVPGALSLNDNGLMRDAAAAGLGIALVPEPTVAAELRDGSLIQVLENWTPPEPGHCLYYSGHRLVPAPLKAFIGVVREADRRIRQQAASRDTQAGPASPTGPRGQRG
ncbi:LysR substrate-binding domain-containing protein [Brevundimonas sp. Root1423]|uniref:LysR substrate-binding domain-containing protein n=1 Tax=Brevundimonas sp. Root1423 TaxID=1736462 RepID=UPI0009EB1729|nr:LysR substrate-binding domain-containing protein [Brevundimonas sp. Root1423]